MAFTFSVNALEKETKKDHKLQKKTLPMQWQKIACSPSFAVTLTQSWSHPDLVINMTARSL